MKPVGLLLAPLRWLLSLVVPMLVRPTLVPGFTWFLHFVLFVLVLVGLWFLQWKFPNALGTIGTNPWFGKFSLPVFGLLLYVLVWLGVWLSRLFGGDDAPPSAYPGLDADWTGALDALQKAGIDVVDTPVFLVLGKFNTEGGEDALFRSTPRPLSVRAAPSAAAAVRVYADRDAIFVCCPSVSALRAQPRAGAAPSAQSVGGGGFDQSIGFGAEVSMGASVGLGGMGDSVGMSGSGSVGGGAIAKVQEIVRRAAAQGRAVNAEEKEEIRRLSTGAGFGGGKQAPSALASREVEEAAAQLAHVCGLIVRTRWPLCPANGVILLIPAAAAQTEDAAQTAGLAGQRDLLTVRDSLRLRCPVYTVVGDVEQWPGLEEFVVRFPAAERDKRLGLGFPACPDMDRARVHESAGRAARWVFQDLLPFWVFKLLKLESTSGRESPAQVAAVNGRLFQFMTRAFETGDRLGDVVARSVAPADEEPHPFCGCYVTGLKPSVQDRPVFALDLFKKFEVTQNYVAWTDAALWTDAGYKSKTMVGYAILAGLALAVVGLGVYAYVTLK